MEHLSDKDAANRLGPDRAKASSKVEVEGLMSRDDQELALLGKKQQLRVWWAWRRRRISIDHRSEEFWLHEHCWVFLHYNDHMGRTLGVFHSSQIKLEFISNLLVSLLTVLKMVDRPVSSMDSFSVGLDIYRSLRQWPSWCPCMCFVWALVKSRLY